MSLPPPVDAARGDNPRSRFAALRERNAAVAAEDRRLRRVRCRARPVHVTVGNTFRCNFDCPMCFRQHVDFKEVSRWDLGLEAFARIAAECFPYALRVELSVSGEPLASPTILEELAIAEAYGLRLSLTTNGSYLIRDRIRAGLLRAAGEISISFDGATEATFERLRRRGRFASVVEGIRRLNEERRSLPPAERPAVGATTVLMRSTIEELPAWVALMHRLGVDSLEGNHILVHPGNEGESLAHVPDLAARMFREAQAVARDLGIPLRLPPLLGPAQPPAEAPWLAPPGEPVPCPYAWHRVWVQHDGTVSPCCHPGFRASMGNVLADGLMAVWNGPAYRQLREALNAGRASSVCHRCHLAAAHAGGGVAAAWYSVA